MKRIIGFLLIILTTNVWADQFIRFGGGAGSASGASIGDTVTGGTTGSVLFIGPASALSQDNAKLFWDNTNFRLGIGNAAPGKTLDVTGTGRFSVGVITPLIFPNADSIAAVQIDKADGATNIFDVDTTNSRVGVGTAAPATTLESLSTTEQLRLAYDSSDYASFTVGSSGQTTLSLTGTGNQNLTLNPAGTGNVNLFSGATAAEKIVLSRDGTFSTISASIFSANTGGGSFSFSANNRMLNGGGLRLLSTDLAGFQLDAVFGAIDTALARNAAGVIEINNGTPGTLRDLAIRDVRYTPTAAGSPPVACAAGTDGLTFITTTYHMCVCKGGTTTYVLVSDGTSACT